MSQLAPYLRALPAIAWLSLAGLAFRLVLAYGLFRGSGFKGDVATFVRWAEALARYGPGDFYANTVADYPPGYLYVLWVIGSIGEGVSKLLGGGTVAFGGDTFTLAFFIDAAILKLPAIAADVLIGLLLYFVVRRWMRDRSKSEAAAIGAAAMYIFNPVTWYDSALWGQMDAVGTLVVLCSVVLLVEGFSEGAVAATVLAGLIKPNYGVVLVPIVALVLLRRHLVAPGSGPPQTIGMRLLPKFLQNQRGPWRLISSVAVGAVVFHLLVAPFGFGLEELIRKMRESAGLFPYLSVNAYNPWALIGAGGHAPLAISDAVGPGFPPAATGDWSPDELQMIGGLSAVTIGAILLASAFLVGLVQLAIKDSRRTILLTVAFLSMAFFVLPTRVHERYAFPVFAFLPLLAVHSRSFTVLTIVAALASLINIHAVLTMPPLSTPDLTSLPFGEATRTFPWVLGSVLANIAVFAYLLWRLRPAVDLVIRPVRSLLGMPPRAPDTGPYDDVSVTQ